MNGEPAAAATPIAFGDDRTRYDPVAIGLHWATALMVVCQFALAEIWGLVPRPTRQLMISSHTSIGLLLTLVIIARIAWRVTPGHQVRAVTAGWVEAASKGVHYLLYGLLAAEAGFGFLYRWSQGQSMNFFGLVIAPPFDKFSRPVHNLIAGAHDWIAWIIIVLAAGHAGAALFHHYVLRDDVLRRMLPQR
jgi:cytochrome b561